MSSSLAEGSTEPAWLFTWHNAASKPRSVAYYRHPAQDGQEDSVPTQQERIREWADENDVEIVQEFVDAGKSERDAEGQPTVNGPCWIDSVIIVSLIAANAVFAASRKRRRT